MRKFRNFLLQNQCFGDELVVKPGNYVPVGWLVKKPDHQQSMNFINRDQNNEKKPGDELIVGFP